MDRLPDWRNDRDQPIILRDSSPLRHRLPDETGVGHWVVKVAQRRSERLLPSILSPLHPLLAYFEPYCADFDPCPIRPGRAVARCLTDSQHFLSTWLSRIARTACKARGSIAQTSMMLILAVQRNTRTPRMNTKAHALRLQRAGLDRWRTFLACREPDPFTMVIATSQAARR